LTASARAGSKVFRPLAFGITLARRTDGDALIGVKNDWENQLNPF
jgi:hypothetical protein